MEQTETEKSLDAKKETYIITGAKTIMGTNYPEICFIIENLIPSYGLILFAGAPKVGKSWFVLQMLLSICYGKNCFLGHKIKESCKCFYLALEDSEARIQSRIAKQGFNPNNDKLLFAFRWRNNGQGVTDIREFLDEHTDIKVVCIDTKGKFSEGREEESFQSDYSWMSELKSVADAKKVAIILITHLRKRKPDEDPYEAISGSSANMAVADTTMMLKRARNQNKGTLYLTSRDFPETEEDIFFDSNTCTWNVPNGIQFAITENMTPERKKIINAMKQIGKECTPKQIADIVGGTAKNISNMLTTMRQYGFVDKGTKRGFWKLPEMTKDEEAYDETIF